MVLNSDVSLEALCHIECNCHASSVSAYQFFQYI